MDEGANDFERWSDVGGTGHCGSVGDGGDEGGEGVSASNSGRGGVLRRNLRMR